jgi:response regulator of citrate/malate metabolism
MNAPQLKILIIDDDNQVCEILSDYFEFKKISSKSVSTLKDALSLMEKDDFNMIFLDNILPDGNGVDYLKKGYFKKKNSFIVLMTGLFKSDLIKDTLKAGVDEFILKPFKLNDIDRLLFKAKNFIESFYDFEAAVEKLEYFNVRFAIDNNINLVKGVGKIILRNVVDAGFFDNESQPLIALSEVLSNAIYHGNLELSSEIKENSFIDFQKEANKRVHLEPYKNRKVYINSYFDKERFFIEVKDEGKGFDWKGLIRKLNLVMETNLPYGRGIFLLVSIFDEVFWNEKGNEITLIKYKSN